MKNNSFFRISSLCSTSQVAKLILCLIGAGMFLSGDASGSRNRLATKVLEAKSAQAVTQKINDAATKISVRVLSQDFLGSGFILRQDNHKYTVITNQHVLRGGQSPYRIQTADGSIYLAQVISISSPAKSAYDLAILEFESEQTYAVASLGNSFALKVGEPIFAGGFPYPEFDQKLRVFGEVESAASSLSSPSSPEFMLKSGHVAIVLDQALKEGYQIGYTNDVRKGMSGGPLLNNRGEVVGVNGKHAYPLWEAPEIYQDGSQPCTALQKLITRSSLAIPIEKSLELTAQFTSPRQLSTSGFTVPPNPEPTPKASNSPIAARLKTAAKTSANHCNTVDKSSPVPQKPLEF